ncbi:MAG: hypothetical protein ACO1N1_11380 [Dyadobacter fermentans]
MRNFLAIACLFLYGLACLAQSPQTFSFQGVARGADGKTVNNAVVGIRISIRSADIQLKLAEISARLDQLAVPSAGANAK